MEIENDKQYLWRYFFVRKHESQFDWRQSYPEAEGSDKIGLTNKNLTSIK